MQRRHLFPCAATKWQKLLCLTSFCQFSRSNCVSMTPLNINNRVLYTGSCHISLHYMSRKENGEAAAEFACHAVKRPFLDQKQRSPSACPS